MMVEAMKQLGCKPKETIAIGDMVTDVQAAHAANIICVGITHGFATKAELQDAGADYIVDSLAEFAEIVV
ncbi:HAD hydrolase-like protein [Candidatus Saccharibacteria bacterium]|nr:MAG: HAD hydrolase-like protein [Candidatus Saccharibacteria bacterium]